MPRLIESLMVPGPVGRLEALLEELDRRPKSSRWFAIRIRNCGTMHNKVVYRLARGLRSRVRWCCALTIAV